MPGSVLGRDEQPGRNRAAIEGAIPYELPVGELADWQFGAKTVDQNPPTLTRGGHETVRCCELGIEEEQASTVRLPECVARGPVRTRDATGTLSCRGNGLQLDVSLPVLQERNRFPIRRPEGSGLVPLVLDEPPYAARPDVEDTDIEVIMDVRHEGELAAVRRPRLGSPEVATDRTLRIREIDDFLHQAGEIHEPHVVVEPDTGGKGDALSIRPPCDLRHDIVHVRELFRLASGRLDDEDVVSIAIPV